LQDIKTSGWDQEVRHKNKWVGPRTLKGSYFLEGIRKRLFWRSGRKNGKKGRSKKIVPWLKRVGRAESLWTMTEEGEVLGKRESKTPVRYKVSGPFLQIQQYVISP
jgi:hypothetical protein